MTPEQEQRMEEIATKVTQIHGHLFGINGHGSWLENVESRVTRLELHKEEVNSFKAKLIGVVGGISLVGSAVGAKISHLFEK